MPIKPEGEPQERPRFLTQADLFRRHPDLLPPDCSWQEMLARSEVLMPEPLVGALRKAKEFLMSEPGSNLLLRQQTTPLWLDYWIRLVGWFCNQRIESRPEFTNSRKLKPFERIRDCVLGKESGALFVAGAEGHLGHLYAANFMRQRVTTTIWVFERDSYFTVKAREAPFLPLEMRLSMWDYFGINYLTVSPERDPQVDSNAHYAYLFRKLGAIYCFATEGDPDLEEKIARGKRSPFIIIPRLPVFSTTDQVKRLFKTVGVSETSAPSIADQVEQALELSVS